MKPGRGPAIRIKGANGGTVQIVLLSQADSLALWKGTWQGRERVFLTKAGLVLDGDTLRLTSASPADLTVGVWPAPKGVTADGKALAGKTDGVFRRFAPRAPRSVTLKANVRGRAGGRPGQGGPARQDPAARGCRA